MKNQEEPFEEELDWGKKKQPAGREAGIGSEGELSAAALRRWLSWSGLAFGVCLLLGVVLAVVSGLRDRKEAAWMEVDFGSSMAFQLNRKGAFIGAEAGGESLVGESLENGLYRLFDLLAENQERSVGDGLLITLRPSETGISTDIDRLFKELEIYAETGLRRKQSSTAIYMARLEEPEELSELSELSGEYGISVSRAAFIRGLVDKNIALRSGDMERLAQLPLKELLEETAENGYHIPFDTVTAKRIYEQLTEESSTAAEESRIEEASETPEPEAEAGSGQETAAAGQSPEASEVPGPEETEETEASEEEGSAEQTEPETADGEPESGAEAEASEEEAPAEQTEPEAENGEQQEEGTTAPEIPAETAETAAAAPETSAEETPAVLETIPISPAETSADQATLAPYQVGPGFTEAEDDRVYEVIPAAPGNPNGPGF